MLTKEKVRGLQPGPGVRTARRFHGLRGTRRAVRDACLNSPRGSRGDGYATGRPNATCAEERGARRLRAAASGHLGGETCFTPSTSVRAERAGAPGGQRPSLGCGCGQAGPGVTRGGGGTEDEHGSSSSLSCPRGPARAHELYGPFKRMPRRARAAGAQVSGSGGGRAGCAPGPGPLGGHPGLAGRRDALGQRERLGRGAHPRTCSHRSRQ